MAKSKPAFRRVLLKVSGEGLAGPDGFGIGREALTQVAEEIRQAVLTKVLPREEPEPEEEPPEQAPPEE